ncbi:MAG TPA: serine hydrolase [Balneolales bacterium]|nr:serine hydrolase [Balneolales bacterium]
MGKNKIGLIIIILACVGVINVHAQQESSVNTGLQKIDHLIQKQINQEHIPGAVLLVVKNGKVLQKKAFGYADEFNYNMQKLKHPVKMNTNTMFDLASLSKVFATTFGIMLLVNQGKIHLNDKVHQYLPDFTGPEKDKITIRQLLNHTSGLYKWQPLYYKASNQNQTYHEICRMPLKYKVGAARHYSDLGFMMLGYLIEKVTGERLDHYLERHLYHPLGLKHTVYNPYKLGFKNIASTSHGNPFERKMVYDDHFGYKCNVDPHSWNGWRTYTLKGQVSDGNAWYANKGIAGHAGLFSTISDLQKLVNLLLNKGIYNRKTMIRYSVIKKFITKDKYKNGLGWDMAPDVIMAKDAPNDTFGHTGFTGTNVVIMPKYHTYYILLTNRENAGVNKKGYYFNLNPLRQKIATIILKNIVYDN